MNAGAYAKTKRMLPGEVPLRETFPSEDEFFKSQAGTLQAWPRTTAR
jgi:hypothetical protein